MQSKQFDPRRTTAAVPVNLAALGLSAGTVITLQETGDFNNGSGTDTFTSVAGVFSTSSTLTSSSNLNRVSGAVVATDPTSSPVAAADRHHLARLEFGMSERARDEAREA